MTKRGRVLCPYTGKLLARSECNQEHIIPRSLGGGRGRGDILVSKQINSLLGSKVDARLAKDYFFIWPRMTGNVKGAGNSAPEVYQTGYWGKDAVKNYYDENLRPTHIYRKTSSNEQLVAEIRAPNKPVGSVSEYAFLGQANLDSEARLKFTIKTLLGINRLLFQDGMNRSIDITNLQHLLLCGVEKQDRRAVVLSEGIKENGVGFTYPALSGIPTSEQKYLKALCKLLEVGNECRVLVQETSGTIEWSCAVLGTLVGSLSIKTHSKILTEVPAGMSLLLRRRNQGFEASTIKAPTHP